MKIIEQRELVAYSEKYQCPSCLSRYLLEQEDITASDSCRGMEYYMTCPVCDSYLQVHGIAAYQKRAIRDGKTLPKAIDKTSTKSGCKGDDSAGIAWFFFWCSVVGVSTVCILKLLSM